MATDLSRDSFVSRKHYSSLRLQQGRALTDADWNEQVDIVQDAARQGLGDAIGVDGAPQVAGGFKVSADGANLRLSAGRFYVQGVAVVNDVDCALAAQPDLPGYVEPAVDGTYLAYLETREHAVTYLEDPRLRDAALGGPDTATRTRDLAQVRLLAISEAPEILTPESEPQAYLDLLAQAPGQLRASAAAGNPDPGADLCTAQLQGGYRSPDNRLYRVEIHTGGPRGTATYKWSRDNGSVRVEWEGASGPDLMIRNATKDRDRGFVAGQWVELTDLGRELRREPGTLARIVSVQGNALRIDPASATGSYDPADFSEGRRIVRRWDGLAGAQTTQAGLLDLEGGVQIEFSTTGLYTTGDAWLIPARSITRGIEWPCAQSDSGSGPLWQAPHGRGSYFARLAFLKREAGIWSEIADARVRFASLAAIARSENQVENKVNRFGDTMTGTLNIEAGLNVDLDAGFGQSVTVQQHLTVKGDLRIEGDLVARDTQHEPGDVLLGDQDQDATIIHGTLRSQHTSGALEIADAAHVHENLEVDGDIHASTNLSIDGDAALAGNLQVSGDTGLGVANPAYRLDVDGTVRAAAFIGDGSLLANVGSDRGYNGLLPEYLYPTNDAAAHGQTDASGRRLYYTRVREREPLLDPASGLHFGRRRVLLDEIALVDAESGPHGERVYRIDGRDDVRIVTDARQVQFNDFNGHRPAVYGRGYFEFTGYLGALQLLLYVSQTRGFVRLEWEDGTSESFDATTALTDPPNYNRYDDPATLIPHIFEAPNGPGLHTVRIYSGDTLHLYGIEVLFHREDQKIDVPAQQVLINGEAVPVAAQSFAHEPDPWTNDYGLSDEASGFFDEGLDAWENYLPIAYAVSDHQAPQVFNPPLNVHDHVLNTSTGTVYRVSYLKNLVPGEHQAASADRVLWAFVCVVDRTVADVTTRVDLVEREIIYSAAQSRVYKVLETEDGTYANTRFHHRTPRQGGRVTWRIHPTKRQPDGSALITSATLWLPPAAQAMPQEAEIATVGAHHFRHFVIDGVDYVAVAFHHNDSGHVPESKIFRREGIAWTEFQSLPVSGSIYSDYALIVSTHYLFFVGTGGSPSKLYRWNGTQFELAQDIATSGAHYARFFTIDADQFLAISNYSGNSVNIQKWNGTQFASLHSLGAGNPFGLSFFTIGTEHYLAIAEYYSGGHNINSRIYRWNGTQFDTTPVQSIATNGAHDAEAFEIGSEHYLCVVNHYNGSYDLLSRIYRWNGSQFEVYQEIRTTGAYAVKYFAMDGRHFLCFGNNYNGTTSRLESALYEWDGGFFREFQRFYTQSTTFPDFCVASDGAQFLLLPNYWNDTTRHLGSKFLRWDGQQFVVDSEYNARDERATAGQSRPVFTAEPPEYGLLEKTAELHPWEFGNGDRNGATQLGFDTLTPGVNSNRAYNFPDGVTGLVGKGVGQSNFAGDQFAGPDASTRVFATEGSMRLSFMGCGLRVNLRRDAALRSPLGYNWYGNFPIASNLGYGTHLCEFRLHTDRSVAVNVDGVQLARGSISPNIESFEIYGPRRARVPEQWVLLGDYVLYADVVQQTEPGALARASGVRRVHALSEILYDEVAASGQTGTAWNLINAVQPDDVGGLVVQSGNSAKTVRYRANFFGTGCVLRFRDNADLQDFTIRLDGSSNLLTYATGAATGSLNPATGQYTASRSGEPASSTWVLGLPSGEHVLEVEAQTIAGRYLYLNAIDVVEPLHRANHYQRHETPFAYELSGGGAGIDARELPVYDAQAYRTKTLREAREARRTSRPAVWANLGKDDGAGIGTELPYRFNVVRSIGAPAKLFGIKGVVYSPGAGKFYIRENGTYAMALHFLANGASSLYTLVNNQVVMYGYSTSTSNSADSGKTIQLALRKGDVVEIRVHFGGGFHSGTVHNQASLYKID